MFTLKHKIIFAIVITLLCVPLANAQQPQPSAAQGDSYVSEKGFRSRVFEIKRRDPQSLLRVLTPLGSGFKGATMSYNTDFKTITVRDFPENIATVEEAIKRLDVAEAPRPGIEFHIHLLIANNTGAGTNQFPAELEDVIKQLRATINYKNYTLMTSLVLRSKEQGFQRVTSKGVAELKLSADSPAGKNPIFYEFALQNISIDPVASGPTKIQMSDFVFSMKVPLIIADKGVLQYESIGFNTPVSLREGEKVVVGTTSMEDKGVIVVLTASITK